MDPASREEIEWCRNYFKFANTNVFNVIDKAIEVAAHDHPNQLRFLRYRIAQRLFPGNLSNSWNFEAVAPPLEISDGNSVMDFDQHRHHAPNPKEEAMKAQRINAEDGGEIGGRPSLIVRFKIKRDEERDQEAKARKRAKKDSRKARKAEDAETKRKLNDGSMQKIRKIRFVHGFDGLRPPPAK